MPFQLYLPDIYWYCLTLNSNGNWGNWDKNAFFAYNCIFDYLMCLFNNNLFFFFSEFDSFLLNISKHSCKLLRIWIKWIFASRNKCNSFQFLYIDKTCYELETGSRRYDAFMVVCTLKKQHVIMLHSLSIGW